MADPASPTDIAHRIRDFGPAISDGDAAWDIEVVSEPFTTGSEDVSNAVARLRDQARHSGIPHPDRLPRGFLGIRSSGGP